MSIRIIPVANWSLCGFNTYFQPSLTLTVVYVGGTFVIFDSLCVATILRWFEILAQNTNTEFIFPTLFDSSRLKNETLMRSACLKSTNLFISEFWLLDANVNKNEIIRYGSSFTFQFGRLCAIDNNNIYSREFNFGSSVCLCRQNSNQFSTSLIRACDEINS